MNPLITSTVTTITSLRETTGINYAVYSYFQTSTIIPEGSYSLLWFYHTAHANV